jgi:hypothetical protein
MTYNARSLFERAASLDVRANNLELTGTYRLEVERTGGPTHVFYGRTEARPWIAERHDTRAWRVERPTGYLLRFVLSRDSSSLPVPGPAPRRRDRHGNGADNSEIAVHLPGTDAPGGTRRFTASVMLVNFIGAFHDVDRSLSSWESAWFDGHFRSDGFYDVAEFVLWPDGRVTLTQREELAPGQVVTLRGERISRDTWECSGEEC